MYTNYVGWDLLLASLGMFAFLAVIIIIAVLILYVVGLWNLFKKAGKNGWEAIIPFYNTWILVEISGLAWWYFLLIISNTITNILDLDEMNTICQLVAWVASFFCYYNISKKLHKDIGFAILMTLFPVIMIPIVGLSNKYQFDQSVIVSEHGPIEGEKKVSPNQEERKNTYEKENKTVNENPDYDSTTKKKFCSNCGNPIETDAKYCGKCGKEI